jgi:hypothetical protein
MPHVRRAGCTGAALLAAALISGPASGGQRDAAPPDSRESGDRKPSLSLKLNPPIGFSPLRVHAVVEVRNGANDFQDFYCAAVEWDWGDGTISENSADCDPYEAGKSEIRRRYSADHTFRTADAYRVTFRLKQRSRVVAAANVMVQVRPGVRDGL